MRIRQAHMWFITLALLSGCKAMNGRSVMEAENAAPVAATAPTSEPAYGDVARQRAVSQAGQPVALKSAASNETVSLTSAASAQTVPQAIDRKVIKNAELDIELSDPIAAQRQLATIAETSGGFIVTAEAKNNDSRMASAPSITATVVMRIPAAQFDPVIEKIRKLDGRILQDKASGQDVTEEYIDLEARIRTQKALEAQMLELLKRAGRISDAIEVQNQVAAVRTEIERLEGRQRFLANQSALSTISITLHTPTPVIIATTAKGFWHQVKQAFGDGIDLASNITLGIIQFVIMLIPILLLIVLPLWLLWRLARPFLKWPTKPAPTTVPVDPGTNP